MRVILLLFVIVCLACAALCLPNACLSSPPVSADKQADDEFEPDEELPGTAPFRYPGGNSVNPYTAPREFRSPIGILSAVGILSAILGVLFLIIAASVKQPADISIVPINYDKPCLYVSQATQDLAALGFQVKLDFTVPELPHQGKFRLMATEDETRTALLYEIETKGLIKQYVNFVEFKTITDNDLKILSNNSPHKNSLKAPPDLFTFRHQEIRNVGDLFNQHRADVDSVRSRLGGRIKPQNVDDFQRQFPIEWRELMQFQRAHGMMKKSGDKNVLKGTVKMVAAYFTPEFKDSESRRAMFAIMIIGALLIFYSALVMPRIVADLGLEKTPFVAAKIEAGIIVAVCLTAAYILATWGETAGFIGFMCFLPSVLLLVSGPIGIFLPIFLAYESATLGAKLRNPPPVGVSLFKHFSPHWYLVLLLFLVVGLDSGVGF
jgi:hypothetical protein